MDKMMQGFVLANAYEVFTALLVLGAIYHWLQKAAKGEASFNPIDYWLKESPTYSAGTAAALAGIWWTAVSTNALAGATWQLIVSSGVGLGYMMNSQISPGSAAAKSAQDMIAGAKQGGFVRWILLPLIAILAACAAFGLASPQSNGQRVVQGYANAIAVTAMIPTLLAPPAQISVDKAKSVQAASKVVRSAIEQYWAAAGLLECTQPGATAAACTGPNALQVLTVINGELITLEQFLLTYQKGAKP